MADQHYVYMYRDLHGNPVYFGKGMGSERPADHMAGTHNRGLGEWLEANPDGYQVEVIGPLGNETIATAVETALISACKPSSRLADTFFNLSSGPTEFRFRPWGVPREYAHRLTRPLDRHELHALAASIGTIMFVLITRRRFEEIDGRSQYDPANPPSDSAIADRVEARWQVANRLRAWVDDPLSSPALLIGVYGPPGRQQVIASMSIDRSAWAGAENFGNGLLRVPVRRENLDAFELRGRPIAVAVGLNFNSFRHQQFKLMGPNDFL